MSTDNELILLALADTPARRKANKVVLQEFDDFGVVEHEASPRDALTNLSKRAKRADSRAKRRLRPVQEWTSADFLVYAQDMLKPYGVHLENNGSQGADMMARLYDKLVASFGHEMNNGLLREYIQWWVLAFGSGIRSHSIYIQTMYDDKYTKLFAMRYNESYGKKQITHVRVEQDDQTIYQTGGLPMLLMSKGIVVTHSFLRQKNEQSIFTKITKVLRTFSISVLKSVMDITVNNAPYAQSDTVDFISIARPALELHGLKTYLALRYGKFFMESNK